VLKWLEEKGRCPYDASACASAAGRGHLEVLKWLRAKGCPWNWTAVKYAVNNGHFEMVKWLIANGCPFEPPEDDDPAWLCHGAARGGHLEMLKWLREEQGC